ncbi:MAG TPA: M56 family metallopeptidase [Thermoanaerobaculia bacterium]|nr:M56 family metallopeptidase [Thermoanaerobaculia bacterium]
MFEHAAAWLLTYALHSTLLLALAWLASGPLSRRSLRLEEAVWRAALLGALATSTFQVATGWHPAGALRLPVTLSAATAAVPAPPIYKEEPAAPALLSTAPATTLAELTPVALEFPAPAPVGATPVPLPSRRPVWMTGLVTLWAAAAFLLSLRLAFAHLGLRRRLRARLEVSGGTLVRILDRLAPEAGLARPVRLTCSPALPVPVALGVLRPEIAVPPRALSHLSAAEQESLLAHELGHLVRRDPVWLAVGQLLASLLFFQPLNWVARRRLREISELLCDEWAVGRTGEPLSLARCLAEVAQWTLEPVHLLPVPGMADRPSNLGRRIHRLLDGGREGARAPRWGLAVLGVLLLSMAVVAPGFTAAEKPAVPPAPAVAPVPPVPSVAPVPEAPDAPDVPDVPAVAEAPEPPEAPDAPAVAPALPALPALPARPHRAPRATHPPRLPRPALAGPLPHHGLTAEERAELESARERGEAGRLTPEQIARIEADADRISREVEEHLKPQMEKLEKLTAQLEAERPSDAELKAMEDQVEAATRHRRSPAEEARFEADVRKLAESGDSLSKGERKRLQEDIRRMAESMRPSAEDLAAIRKFAERHAELSHKLTHEQLEEMATARREIQKEMAVLRETLQRDLHRELKGLHEERERREALPRPHPRALPAPQVAPAPRPHPRAVPALPARPASPAPPAPPARPHGRIPGAVSGGVEGGIPGGVEGGVPGGIEGGVPGGVEGAAVPPPPPAPPP